MGILSGIFKARDKPTNATAGSGYRFLFGNSTSGKNVTERSAMQMTSFVFRETLMTHLLLWGNSAVFPSALTAAMGSSAGNVQPSFTNFETTTSSVRSNSNTLFFLQETGIPCLPMPLDFFWTIIKLRDRLPRAAPPVR